MRPLTTLLAVVIAFTAVPSVHANQLFQDQFTDMSHVVVQTGVDQGVGTWSVGPSPGGLANNSLHVSYDGVDEGWAGRADTLGGLVPATGTFTLEWHFYRDGTNVLTGQMGAVTTADSSYGIPMSIVSTANVPAYIGVTDDNNYALHPVNSTYAVVNDQWYTAAIVINQNGSANNASLYVSSGLTVGTGDLLLTSTSTFATHLWEAYQHGYVSYGPWDLYIADLTLNSGQDFTVPEPASVVTLLIGCVGLVALRRHFRIRAGG